MAAVLMHHHTYSPGPSRGILLNPSPAASPAYHPASLPALVPSNSSLSSSASSSAPGEDYFSSKSSSPSPGPSSSGSPAPRSNTHLHPQSKPRRHGSNPSTARVRFAPLPEPRRDLDGAYAPVFVDDDAEAPHPNDPSTLSLSSALAAATLSLAAPGDSDLCRRTRSLPPSVTSSPATVCKALPSDSHLLDASIAQSASASDSHPCGTDAQHTSAHSDLGQEWDVLPPSSPALPALSLPLCTPDSPRKSKKWSKMLKPLLGRSSAGSNAKSSSLMRTTSAEEIAAMNHERGRGAILGLAGSRNSSRSRDASVSRERDQGRDRREADFGLPLHRWTSEGQPVLPLSKKKKHSLFGGGGGGGVPLGRTQSLTSLSSKDDRKAAARPVVATNGGRKQQRMLNGRVYGAKRNANPFANVRSEEPEFVEWGYGGMGSVKASAGQSEIWQRVQKGSVAIGGENGSWGPRPSTEDDDGSGMAWLKKRREQREREKKEREEKMKAEAGQDKAESKIGEATPEKLEDEQKADAQVATAAEAPAAPTSADATLTSTPAPSTPLAHEEHITQTVKIPAPHHRHHHSHSHSHSHSHHHGHGHSLSLSLPQPERRESADTARGVPFVSLTPLASATPTGQPESTDDTEGTPILGGARLRTESITEGENGESVSSSATSTASTTSEDVDSEDSPKDTEGGFGDEDEDEEDLLEKEERKTALSAGMEKIARHKEHDHAHEQPNPSEEAAAEQASS